GAGAGRVGKRLGGFEARSSIHTANCLTERLRRNGASFDADPTNVLLLFHHGHFFPKFGGLYGRSLPSRTTAQADEIILVTPHSCSPPDTGCASASYVLL